MMRFVREVMRVELSAVETGGKFMWTSGTASIGMSCRLGGEGRVVMVGEMGVAEEDLGRSIMGDECLVVLEGRLGR